MAMITYPLNNIEYQAEDAELFHCTRTSGIWAEDSFPISVTGADNNVTVGAGIAWINNEKFSGKVAALKTTEIHDLGIADSMYPRIDVIAIQFNANNNATSIVIKTGTPASKPVRPAITRTGSIYELYLAEIRRPAGATTITAANVTDSRLDETVCGLMADSVTKIDTKAINAQVTELIDTLQNEIESIKKGEISASLVPYDNSVSNIDSENVQGAIDEIALQTHIIESGTKQQGTRMSGEISGTSLSIPITHNLSSVYFNSDKSFTIKKNGIEIVIDTIGYEIPVHPDDVGNFITAAHEDSQETAPITAILTIGNNWHYKKYSDGTINMYSKFRIPANHYRTNNYGNAQTYLYSFYVNLPFKVREMIYTYDVWMGTGGGINRGIYNETNDNAYESIIKFIGESNVPGITTLDCMTHVFGYYK